jgi:hypothetical protein
LRNLAALRVFKTPEEADAWLATFEADDEGIDLSDLPESTDEQLAAMRVGRSRTSEPERHDAANGWLSACPCGGTLMRTGIEKLEDGARVRSEQYICAACSRLSWHTTSRRTAIPQKNDVAI